MWESAREVETGGPMSVYVIIPFRTTDYAWWKEIFDKFAESRLGWGALAYVIYKGLDDPEAITVVHEFAAREGAARFIADPSIRVSVASWNADVVPEMHLFEEVGRRP
jgi:hypothetical protein